MWGRIGTWYADPYSSDMDAASWFLFIGFLICAAILWRIVLSHILEGVS